MVQRTCKKCLVNFEGWRNSKYCPECKIKTIVEYQKNYFKNLPKEKRQQIAQKQKPYFKQWTLKNQDKVRQWKEKNKEKLLQYAKEYNQEYQKQQRILNPVKVKEKRRERFYKDYYNRTIEEVNELKKIGCYLCGYNKLLDMVCLHHIDKNPKNNNAQNLKPLCMSCHYAVHKGFLQI